MSNVDLHQRGVALVTVETEANEDSKKKNERGPSVGWFRWSRRVGTRTFYYALAAMISPVLFHFTPYVSQSPSNLGRQSCRAACL
jgi:hypothetical protein